ncbi:amino acid/amide ABC transporter substrate-binding protein, HAAT family [Tistlia consotensis]|uniref:Amino acid/amide ABC transporter substrate-binding protein, HAAT family n=1 Tax=Tistlia consotensis USBA 355 TaxID=560819 RepID=A0A1Y6C602_9PROT|nr:ABC transporter substrate-binding protein [Tistlia consotensis]SMF47463.1 amino acid/amide ABC transporter substrate-binding protein, HAAT family [Tistlia consotensis USBA 355]SNR82458.1 amino acid/amide ABC transporter substrate-binding protein, HAAT family [Tistlia consotensis]
MMKKTFGASFLAVVLAAGPAMAQEAVQIGVSAPLTGPVAHGGEHEMRGIRLAVEEINAKGGVLGKPIALTVEDNQCNPSVSVTVANKLIEDGVVAIIGAQCSSAVLAAMPVVQKAGVPLVSGIATSPSITEKAGIGGNPWVFRLNPSDRELAVADVNYLASLGSVKRVAIVAESTDYGRGGAEAFAKAAEAKGIEVVSTDFHPLGAADFTTILTRLGRSGAQAIALYQAPADRANFVRQKEALGVKAALTGKLNFAGEAHEKLLADGAFDQAVTAFPYAPEVDTPANKAFVAKLVAKYGETSQYESFAGYEEVYVLAAAIERAGTPDRAAVRAALTKTSYASMLGGTITFDDHDQAHNKAVISRVDGSKVTVVDVFSTN